MVPRVVDISASFKMKHCSREMVTQQLFSTGPAVSINSVVLQAVQTLKLYQMDSPFGPRGISNIHCLGGPNPRAGYLAGKKFASFATRIVSVCVRLLSEALTE